MNDPNDILHHLDYLADNGRLDNDRLILALVQVLVSINTSINSIGELLENKIGKNQK